MTAIQQFIENAIKGGWNPTGEESHEIRGTSVFFYDIDYLDDGTHEQTIHEILLDPLAWQAVGKTRGWKGDGYYMKFVDESCFTERKSWKHKFHIFVHHLADSKTIEEALQALS